MLLVFVCFLFSLGRYGTGVVFPDKKPMVMEFKASNFGWNGGEITGILLVCLVIPEQLEMPYFAVSIEENHDQMLIYN